MTRSQRLAALGLLVAWAGAYAVAMYAGRATRVSDSGLSLVWPAAGVATIWLLSSRGRARSVVAVVACAAVGVAVGRATTPDLVDGLTVATVATTHPVVAVLVMRSFGWGTARPPRTLLEIPVLLLSSAAAGLASAVVGVVISHLRFGGMWWEGAWQLSSRNTVSGFVATVVLLALPRLGDRVGPARTPERVLLAIVTLAGTFVVMSVQLPVLYLLVPLTVMVAMRCGPHLTSGLIGAQGLIVVIETMRAKGPLVELLSPEVRVLLAQLLIMVLAVLGMVIAQEEEERTAALRRSQAAEARLVDLALHDQLTGLPNRTLVGDRIEVGLAEARRSGISMAILYIDLDRFKQINDTRGHDGGDRVLRIFADRLSGLARAHDTVARLGGDEFVMVCPAVADIDHARSIASRVVRRMDEPFDIDGEPLMVTASVGLTLVDGRDGSVRDVLRRADAALYAAKDHGRSRYEVFDAAEQGSAAAV